ncbi:uncharacterized protein CTRU02_200446 [Colletotrichum truncatum]|uniref:Uncharacterized protein n=1 Tax=Colletotrichum truncatum TaxID=5467 RepID=A0ACC3ZEL1_COLTU|nr:uncharacterized protein CTRU02_00205 [Colletotrichum truncatum]KAF6801456.1 hypothetical protein CTRU02_00205 [Colletotrichum truncatum]
MAAPPFDAPLPGSSFFDIYNDGAVHRNPVSLPGGACNYVDLTPGANGAKCGCRRFWSRFAAGRAYADNLGTDNSVWCMCSHHACYHDDGRAGSEAPVSAQTPTTATAPALVAHVAGQENEKPRMPREPLSPVQLPDMSFRLPIGIAPTVEFMNLDAVVVPKPEEPRPRPPDLPSQRPESSLQDTLSWGDFIQSQSGINTTLPPIPAQCLMPSQPSSTASSSQARYLRPFAGKGLQTLSGVAPPNYRSPHKENPQDVGSFATQLGHKVTKDDAGAMALRSDNGADTPRAQSPRAPEKVDALFAGPSRDTLRHLSDTVQGHEHRLEKLETVSFSAAGHEECHEKHDGTDLRVTDLEVRMEEVEKFVNDNGSHGTGRRIDRQNLDESTNSVVSVATSTTTRAAHSHEIYSQIQSLQSQLLQLQSQLPSMTQPWEIEVIFLPFPLKKIWQEFQDFKVDVHSNLDEWTQMPNTNSSATLRAQSPFCAEWADPGHDHEWLMAKAFGPRSLLEQRLRSRGLVRTVSIKGSNARSVQAAMHAAFSTTFAEFSNAATSSSRRRSFDGKAERFLGLQQPWVPLRKIHKDSRLRFLTPAEMVTPALWDVSFLHSIIMRCSLPRLFITQPEAYLQDMHSFEYGWTWQRLREMSRFYPDSQIAQEVPEADAREDYWAWNDQLDEAPSTQSSLSIRQARQRVSASPSVHHLTMQSSMRSSSPMMTRAQTSMRERKGPKPAYIRTTSMPPSVPAHFSPAQIKRRVSSFGQQKIAAQIRTSPPNMSTAYKRRRTRSPSRPRNTPRWTISPSPAPGMIPADERHQPGRGITPLYYATPYSNAPLTESRPRGSGGVVDESNTEDDGQDDENHGPEYGSTNPYDEEGSEYSVEVTHLVTMREGDSSHARQMQPEDEPWPGIEDQDHISDGENIDPLFSPAGGDDDAQSDVSSQPSEYPSTQRGWQVPGADDGVGFRIHEDNDRMQNGWP